MKLKHSGSPGQKKFHAQISTGKILTFCMNNEPNLTN